MPSLSGCQHAAVSNGSRPEPVKVIASGIDLGGLAVDDYVIVTGISSLELDGSLRKPIIRVYSDDGIRKLN